MDLHAREPLKCCVLAELLYDRGNPYEFTSLVRELEGPGAHTCQSAAVLHPHWSLCVQAN